MAQRSAEKQKHLGRGLESLLGPMSIPEKNPSPLSSNEVDNLSSFLDKTLEHSSDVLPLDEISVNPYQTRTHWDEEKLNELASSIKANGIIQPVVVRRLNKGYELIAGERRFRASKMLGKSTIPAIVREATDEQMLELALVENIHRADLNPLERANAYERYVDTFSLSQTEAAEKLGEDRSVVCNHLRLLHLPKEVQVMLVDGRLSMGHARAILALPNDDLRRKIANRALAGRLSVREVEKLVRISLAKDDTTKGETNSKTKAPHILELEDKMTNQFGSRVKIETKKGGQRGKVVIEFKSLDEFDQVLDRMGIQYDEEL